MIGWELQIEESDDILLKGKETITIVPWRNLVYSIFGI